MSKLWILTEERPKKEVIEIIFTRFAKEKDIGFITLGDLKIVPLIQNGLFTFTYQVLGINTPEVSQILIKTVSGKSSFVDYLIYYQEDEPSPLDVPLLAIEETKTDDSESRNTGVFQRCTKFVYIDLFYKNVKKIMLYSLQVNQKDKPTPTNVFGSKLLATYGIEVIGKFQNQDQATPFESIDELINFKNSMKMPPTGNTPILIHKSNNEIKISGRLFKSGSLSHDPNIGALSIISAVLRKLGWKDKIIITRHGLLQEHLPKNNKKPNKFIQIANKLNIELESLNISSCWCKEEISDLLFNRKYIGNKNNDYWHFEKKGEKLGTIFIHLVVDAFTQGYSIFENHAGCEKSYFRKSDGTVVPLQKYSDRNAYKAGDKTAIAYIPDLILIDIENLEVINIEGKTYENKEKGILELNNYDFIENEYIKPSYYEYDIIRTVVLYGSDTLDNSSLEAQIGFLLNKNGKMILGVSAPKLFCNAIANLLDYWKHNL
ncbi:hypothetical protein [Aggregatibacter actinomycetemcomitans]|uniref:hypothetical protein n=1 Tax=Aggregatibacter actinomycetemcomitans TaxID=714 RepID=UPI0011D6F790|nr:hypothetical protein [Aggregatibacter actinomycetemcomitans]TYA13774.1 hypothetical protein FXE10_10150 [Aggregatibacter actinomycetemcomitans]TYA32021.1 hypothetical protein FXB69_10155 [Aggregatibacter actinomycetemcomitans]TYA98349.1 hypothetical protein FXB93_10165 [Aggregatibacter actinomycetemcomitans]TYB13842.1 hypothetical protein FXB76_10170 [Aggregatibacter actinomycetemcomitans]TYB24122.1 hypothetical protein FXB80_10205 [Aggregatibacter actinomycetemcomitans]